MYLKRYVFRRIILYILILSIVVTLNFVLPRLMPGNPFGTLLARLSRQGMSSRGGTELVEVYMEQFGLNKDILTQLTSYLSQLFRGNLGLSIMAFPKSVQRLIADALPWTIGLLLSATMISWSLGTILGAVVGWRRDTKASVVLTSLCLFLNQIPYYMLSLIFLFLFAYLIHIFPTSRAYAIDVTPGLTLKFIISVLYHSFLPSISIVISAIGGWMIGMRQMMVNILGEDYLVLAEAKGLRRTTILIKYAVRNALLPQVTDLAMALGFVMSGSMIVESIFAYPGIGTLYMKAIMNYDYNLMQGIFLLSTLTVLAATVLIDLIYPLIDPRVRVGQ